MERRALPRPLKIAALMLLCAAIATPCSFDDTPILFLEARPDAPIDAYVDGRLGIVQPTYARSHLVVAFRYLSGRTPNAIEREGFRDLLRHRLKEYPDDARPLDPAEQWERMRTTFRGIEYKWPPYGGRSVPSGAYETFDNCNDSSWSSAAATFAQRIKELGATNPAVVKWLDAQELVLANCDEDAAIPEEDPTLPAVLRADRQYQIA
ncbi:MAG TPA: hypothetical protein VHK90_01255, partial [Thermoanaerobaculia bacterium]|nr:hypothetical protein [Thermoanaerobaculia bacterium]